MGMENAPRVRNVNLLLLFTMVLVASIGSVFQVISLNWGLLITEFVLILGPALVFLLLRRKPMKEMLRLRWPGWRLILLSLLLGFSLWPLAALLDILSSLVFGYTTPVPPQLYPRSWIAAIPLLFNLVIAAPLCEEFLFRGVVLRAYERYGAWLGIVLSALLFAFFHMRFQGVVALIPVALVLGYVVWRSNSLLAGVAVHFSYNLGAGLYLVIASLRPDTLIGALPVLAMLPALALAAAGLWLFHRQPAQVESSAGAPARLPRLRETWPLIFAALIYVVMAGFEFTMGVAPEILAFGNTIEFRSSTWQSPAVWRYELRTELNERVGEAHCRLTPGRDAIRFECESEYDASDSWMRFVQPQMGESTLAVSWSPADLGIQSAESYYLDDGVETRLDVIADDSGDLAAQWQRDGNEWTEETLTAGALLAGEWPWRVATLPLDVSYVRRAMLAAPPPEARWGRERKPAVQSSHVLVKGAEPVGTPAGNFLAWRVTAGDQTAWIDVDQPQTVVQFDDGRFTWVLVGSE
jgi:membrane protease YdiL (CAAX protease family)